MNHPEQSDPDVHACVYMVTGNFKVRFKMASLYGRKSPDEAKNPNFIVL